MVTLKQGSCVWIKRKCNLVQPPFAVLGLKDQLISPTDIEPATRSAREMQLFLQTSLLELEG